MIVAMSTAAPPTLTLYWQPGCTSCLRTREFLAERDVAFESVNVRADAGALERLAALGLRSVPVLVRGGEFVFAQDLAEVARFVGLPFEVERLEPPALFERLADLLEVAASLAERWPESWLRERLPERPRRHADLIFHIGMIVEGLLDAADPRRDGALTYAHFERLPPEDALPGMRLAAGLRATRAALEEARSRCLARGPAALLRTYYGERPSHEVLERSTWHVAQHVRQLHFLAADVLALPGVPPLAPRLLAGLPLPERVWDAEMTFGATTGG